MKCPRCGKESNSKFCPNCGHAMVTRVKRKNKKSNNFLLSILLGFVVFIAIIMILILILTPDFSVFNNSSTPSSSLQFSSQNSTSNSMPSSSKVDISSSSSSSSEESSSEEVEIILNSINGSNGLELVTNLELSNIPIPEVIETDNTYQWISTTENYSYDITTNLEYEIISSTFSLLSPNADATYLSFCANLPYDNAKPEEVTQWVLDNIGINSDIILGDAKFELLIANDYPVLKVTAIDVE